MCKCKFTSCTRTAATPGLFHMLLKYLLEPCPDGWVDGRQIGAHGACYLFANNGDGLNWNEAKEYCTSNGGYLTDILDQETQDFIAVTSENFPGITWWIGGNDFEKVCCKHLTLGIEG